MAKNSFIILTTFMACIVLSSCMDYVSMPSFPVLSSQDSPPVSRTLPEDFEYDDSQVVETEVLLDADGNWHMVEQGRVMDPAKAHLAARQQVNIRRREPMKSLTAHFEPDAKSGQDGTLRVLRVEAKDAMDDDFMVLGDIVDDNQIASAPQAVAPAPKVSAPVVATVAKDSLYQGREKPGFLSGIKVPKLFGSPKKEKNRGVVKAIKDVEQPELAAFTLVPPDLPESKMPRSEPVPVPVRKADVPLGDYVVPGVKPALAVDSEGVPVPVAKPVRAIKQLAAAPAQIPREVAHVTQSRRPLSYATEIRSGRHPGKTRIVIEVTNITKYKVAIDELRNVLRIKMDDTQWDMEAQSSFWQSKLLGTYIARQQNDGSVLLEVRLKEPTKIVGTLILQPNKTSKYRVVVDLKD